jgi:outer membrane protein
MNKFFLLGIIAFTNILVAQQRMELSLSDAIVLGEGSSKLLRISDAKVEAANAKTNESQSDLLPSLQVSGGYKRLSDVDPFEVKLPIFPSPIVISPTVLNNYSVTATLQQPLFTGFKLSSNARAAKFLADAAQQDNQNDRSNLVLTIVGAYWTLYQAIRTKEYMDENADRLETYLKDTQNLLKAGMATKNDLLKIQVQLSNANVNQIDAENDVRVAMMNLNNAMGQSLDNEYILVSVPDSLNTLDSVSSRTLIAKALQIRTDLQAERARVNASEENVTAAAGNFWPQIFLAGDYYYARPNPRYLPTRDEFLGTWDIGVSLQWNLWNWGATASQTEQARAVLTQNKNILAQMEDEIALEVRRESLTLFSAQKKVDVARSAIDQAEENMRSTRDKFRTGLATSADLLDASVALLQAKTNYTGALVSKELAKTRLSKAVGELR